jgi:ferredoxin
MRVVVDEGLCVLSGYCAETAPHVFELSPDSEVASVKVDVVVDPDDQERAREARDLCPMAAITVIED